MCATVKTDVRQHHHLMPPPIRGGGIIRLDPPSIFHRRTVGNCWCKVYYRERNYYVIFVLL